MIKIKKLFTKLLLVLVSINISILSGIGAISAQANTKNPAFFDMKARSAYAIDAASGQVLYQKNATKRYPVASVTKILTLAVIEQDIRDHKMSWNQKIKITPEVGKVASDWHFSNVQLNVGESYSVKQLVDSMMLVSADGSTEALALASAGSTAAFNKKMQKVARAAGVTDAKIYNMIGLPNGDLGKNSIKGVDKDAENLFSARDMALISKYVINKYPETLNITKKKFANFDISADNKEHMVNINALLPQNGAAPKDWQIDGLKTGNTDAAGKCIVSTGTYAGRRVIVVALHTKGDWTDQSKVQKEFYEQLAANYQPQTVTNIKDLSKSFVKQRVVHAKKQHSTTLALSKPATVWLPKNTTWQQAKPTLKISSQHRSVSGKLEAPLHKGEQVGWVEITPAGLPAMKLPVKTTQSLQRTFF